MTQTSNLTIKGCDTGMYGAALRVFELNATKLEKCEVGPYKGITVHHFLRRWYLYKNKSSNVVYHLGLCNET